MRLLHLVGVTDDVDELWCAGSQGPQGLTADDRLRAAAADPSAEAAVGGDDGAITRTRRGRRLDAHDGREHAWRARGLVLPQQVEDFVAYSFTPAARSAAQTLSEVTGMSILRTPYGERASMTALT